MHRRRNNQRAAKERKRISRAAYVQSPEFAADLAAEVANDPRPAPVSPPLLRFRVTIECLTDGERVQFTTAEGPHGLTVSPTLAGRKVTAVLRHYRPV